MSTAVGPPPASSDVVAPAGRPPWTVRRVWWVSFALLGLAGVVWAFASPVMASPDETAQAVKAVAAVRGQIRGTEVVTNERDPKLLNRVLTTYEIPAGYSALDAVPACYAFYPKIPANCAPYLPQDSGATVPATTYVGRYPPTFYVAVGWPSLFLGPARALRAMRLVSVVLSAALLATAASAIVDLGRRRGGMVVIGLALAVTPSVLFIGSSINASAVEITAGIATWVTALALVAGTGAPTRSLVVRTAISISAFALARPVSPLLVGIALVVVWLVAGSRERVRELWADRTSRVAGVVVAVIGALASAYILATGAFGSAQGFPIVDKGNAEIAQFSLGEFPWRTRQMIGVFGWLDTPLNPATIVVWLLAVAAVVVGALWWGRGRDRLGLLAVAAALVVVPTAAELAGAHQVGTVWQGRYSLPIAVGLPIVAGFALDRARRPSARVVRVAAVLTGVLVAVVQTLSIVTSVRRYATGADNPLFAYLSAGVWSPPGGPWPLLLAAIAVFGLCGAAVAAFTWRQTPPATGDPAPLD